MPTIKNPVFHAVAFLCGSTLLSDRCLAADTVTAIFRDGRSVTGIIDMKTDANYLWLRRTSDNFELVSGYPWDQVLEGRAESRRLDSTELRMWTQEKKQAGRLFAEIVPVPQVDRQPTIGPQFSATIQSPKTLVIKAQLAQWDKDAQTDGLRIFVSPLDTHGRIVPVDGRIEFTLVVQQEHINGGQSFAKRPEFVEGDRFSYVVKRDHFSAGAAFYELSFSKWHPDFKPNIAHQALLYARLSVPGRGVFEASDAQICLREPSRFRDQLEVYTPGRYLPLESNGRENR